MGWKDWSYWLRGGVIGGVLGIILSVSVFLTPGNIGFFLRNILIVNFNLFFIVEKLIYNTLVISSYLIFSKLKLTGILYIMIFIRYIFLIIEFVLLGALIGFLYGKIKSRKQGVEE